MTEAGDILVELSADDLVELREKYSEAKDANYVYTLIDLAIKSKENSNFESITITSPNNTWRQDGSIIVLLDMQLTGIFSYSFDRTYRNVCEGLLKTKRINPSDKWWFVNIHANHVDIILDVAEKLNKKVLFNNENFFYAINIETAKAFQVIVPSEVYVKKLNETHAEKINEAWPWKYKNSGEVVAMWIKHIMGYGLFTKNEDELIAWALQGPLGHINLLQTSEKYQGKGYGKIMLQIMAKHIADNGNVPYATVLVTNNVSNNLFNKVGFQVYISSNTPENRQTTLTLIIWWFGTFDAMNTIENTVSPLSKSLFYASTRVSPTKFASSGEELKSKLLQNYIHAYLTPVYEWGPPKPISNF